jgi:hypothetical protein
MESSSVKKRISVKYTNFYKITRQACVEGTAWNYCDWILTDRPGLFGLLPGRAARHLRIDNADKKVGTNNLIHEQPLSK